MTAVGYLLGYAAVLTFAAPAVLTRLTRGGASPRLGMALWLSTIGLAVAAWLAAGVGIAAAFVMGHGSAPARFCLHLLVAVHHLGPVGDLALAGGLGAAAVASMVVLRRTAGTVRRFWSRSVEHADAARILGAPTTPHPGVVVLPAPRAAAYCVAGRPDAIVVTSAAVDVLPGPQLAAVVAHERAHLAARHPQLMMVLRALAAAMPRLPLFGAAVRAVAPLVEMCADDEATRRCGRDAVLSSLVTLARPARPPASGAMGSGMGVADVAVASRAWRLAAGVDAAERLRQQVALLAAFTVIVCLPGALTFVCHP